MWRNGRFIIGKKILLSFAAIIKWTKIGVTSSMKSWTILKFHTFFKSFREVFDFSSGKSYILCHILPRLHVPYYVHYNAFCGCFIQHIKLMGIVKVVEWTIVCVGIDKQCLKYTIRRVHVVCRRQFPTLLSKQERMIPKVIVGITNTDIEGNSLV